MNHPLFRIGTRDHLGLILMGKLAECFSDRDRWLSLDEVARWGNFSQGYLEEIVAPLRQAKLVEARKGNGGGYRLVDEPRSITVSDILTALHGPIALVPCLDESVGCELTASCGSHHMWSTVQNEISKTIERITLADIAKKPRAVATH